MHVQSWDPVRYARNARFVSDLALGVVELLDPRPGERILDLGCGDGVLTEKLAALGCAVVGVDSSREQVGAAQARGLDARVKDCQALDFNQEFDAAFSNAALHWMKRPDDVLEGVRKALKPGGRFVAEFGGAGCVQKIRSAIGTTLRRRGLDPALLDPWYFPTADDYGARLEVHGFVVDYLTLFDRPTDLPGELADWLETFAEPFTAALASDDRVEFRHEVQDALRPELCDRDGHWRADYVRLRFAAHLGKSRPAVREQASGP